jgi:hypothetical protein
MRPNPNLYPVASIGCGIRFRSCLIAAETIGIVSQNRSITYGYRAEYESVAGLGACQFAAVSCDPLPTLKQNNGTEIATIFHGPPAEKNPLRPRLAALALHMLAMRKAASYTKPEELTALLQLRHFTRKYGRSLLANAAVLNGRPAKKGLWRKAGVLVDADELGLWNCRGMDHRPGKGTHWRQP